jgi:hypothetical protein
MLTSAAIVPIIVQLAIALIVLRQPCLMAQGVPYSLPCLILLPGLLPVLWGLTELESTLFTPWALPFLLGSDTAILIVTAAMFAWVAQRVTETYRGPGGEWNYRIGFGIPAVFPGAFILRITLAAILLPVPSILASPRAGIPRLSSRSCSRSSTRTSP